MHLRPSYGMWPTSSPCRPSWNLIGMMNNSQFIGKIRKQETPDGELLTWFKGGLYEERCADPPLRISGEGSV